MCSLFDFPPSINFRAPSLLKLEKHPGCSLLGLLGACACAFLKWKGHNIHHMSVAVVRALPIFTVK